MTAGSLNIVESSPPTTPVEPISLAEAQEFLQTNLDGATILGLITAARQEAERQQWRELVRKQYELELDQFPDGPVELLDPLVSVESVIYRDSTGIETLLVEGTDYIVDARRHPGLIKPPTFKPWPWTFPWPSSALRIVFTAGMTPAQVPEILKLGMKELITAWYEKRLPWDDFRGQVLELPFAVSSCLSFGTLKRFS